VHVLQYCLVAAEPCQFRPPLDLEVVIGATVAQVVRQCSHSHTEKVLIGEEKGEGGFAVETLGVELRGGRGTSMRLKAWEKLW
jgi:hypothetical protein